MSGAKPVQTVNLPQESTVYQLTGVTKTYQKGRGTVQALQGVDWRSSP